MRKQVEQLNRTVIGTLISSDIGKKNDDFFGVTNYRKTHPDGSFEEYRKFYTLKGEGLEIAKRELSQQGLNGKLSNICNQSIYNGSKVLRFGEDFELDLQKVDGRISVSNIRPVGDVRMRAAASLNEVESALGGIEVLNDEVNHDYR
ncbi:MAG: hypothetical protein CME71_00245 [Halobacteriovorax sp.]|nr:hypothetical protein [Halobacteriovorax sp.]|tara:strand:+ start:4310 stop:4750 length:441 start_codon:yes stop_codon:yes gene_type:complete